MRRPLIHATILSASALAMALSACSGSTTPVGGVDQDAGTGGSATGGSGGGTGGGTGGVGATSGSGASSGTGGSGGTAIDAGSPCGGFAGLTCGANEWCDFPPGEVCGFADGMGVCQPRPPACDESCPGVCGCDGQFYCNECKAQAAGVDVSGDRGCMPDAGTPCNDYGGPPCGLNEWCDAPGQTCGPLGGTCLPRPTACDADCPGVCGCDGQFYCNECMAQAAGVDISTDTTCQPPKICGGLAGTPCDPGEYCDYDPSAPCGAFDQRGVCRPVPTLCNEDCPGVCGCDGSFYCNECMAQAAGVDVSGSDSCKSTSCTGLDFCECYSRPDCTYMTDTCICPCDYQCAGYAPCACACGGGDYLGCEAVAP